MNSNMTATGPSEFRPVVVAPTYNNARMLYDVLTQISAQQLPVIVVNDGSTDDTPQILNRWTSEQQGGPSREAVTHPVNQGKAAGLLTGFATARERGFTHAVTIDTDGQLDPAQINDLLAAAREHPEALIVGNRDMTAPDYPPKSKTGRRVSNLMVRWESGLKVPDSQCGFRVYPLDLVKQLPCNVGRYGFETEILTRTAWAGVEVIPVPVRCKYDIAGGRISHLHPTKDTLRGIAMHLWLLLRAFIPFTRRLDDPEHRRLTGTIVFRLMRWFNPVRAWQEVKHDPDGRSRFAFGLALGVFISNFPVYGIHTIMALYAAKKLKLHPVPLVVGSHLSTPPLTAPLVVLSIATGHLILKGSWPSLHAYTTETWGQYVWMLHKVMWEFIVGSLVFGAVTAGLTYVITLACLWFAKEETPSDRPDNPISAETSIAHRR